MSEVHVFKCIILYFVLVQIVAHVWVHPRYSGLFNEDRVLLSFLAIWFFVLSMVALGAFAFLVFA